MAVPVSPDKVYEACLVELHKSMRAASFYSLDHPALGQSLDRTLRYFQNLLRVTERLEFTVTKNQVLFNDKPLTGQPQVLTALAQELFRRRMKKIIFLAGIEQKDLLGLLRAIKMDPDVLAEKGGMESALAKSGVRTIFANEVDFQRLEEVEEEEEQPEEEEIQFNLTPEQKALRDVLAAMLKSDGADFMRLLKEVMERCEGLTAEGQHKEVGVAVDYLFRYTADSRRSVETREFAERAIRALATKEVLQVKIEELATASEDDRMRLSMLFQYIGKVTVSFLLNNLSVVEDRVARRNLNRTIIDFGAKALPRVVDLLHDERWYVRRNMLAILAEVGTGNELEHVLPHLRNDDERVAREAVKTLGKLGGEAGLTSLLGQLDDLAPGAQVQAAALFGQRKWQPAAERLMAVAASRKYGDEVRVAAIDALGKISDPERFAGLSKIFKRKGLFQRSKRLPIRRAALRALVNYGEPAVPFLRKAAEDADEEIRNIARPALERLGAPGVEG
jgi:HEAT repeat protein